MLLEVNNIVTFYGLSLALDGVSLSIDKGEVVSLLGRNGAGKTTTLKSIMGLVIPKFGSIKFKGNEIVGKKPFEIARMGIGYMPDDRRIFPDLTVEENLEISRRTRTKNQEKWTIQAVYELFPTLKELRTRKGIHLSGGEQKMLAIGRALMKSPDLLLLDEPAEGLSPLIVQSLIEAILKIKQQGVTILVADQNLRFCRKIADRGYIIDRGTICYQGSLNEIWQNEEIVKKYLAV